MAKFNLEQLDTLLQWIEGEFARIIAEMESAGQAQAPTSNLRPSMSGAAHNARQLRSGKKARRPAKRATSKSVTGPVRSSNVLEASRKGTSPLDCECARQRDLLLNPQADIISARVPGQTSAEAEG